MNNGSTSKLVAGTLLVGTAAATVPMAGCEPVTATAVAAATVVTLELLLEWIAQAAVSWVVVEVGEAIYVMVENAFTGEKTQYRLQPGDVVEMNDDGSFTVR